MPYPGTTTTLCAVSSIMATSSGDVLFTVAYTSSASAISPFATAPNNTLRRERFIALHIMLVKIIPDAPTSDPETIRTLLPITKPVADAAKPE